MVALHELVDVYTDEPVFVLRAQDTFAADLVERWANLAEASRCPAGKVLAARAVARAMFEWRTKKLPD
jgi:hypothetical protein